MKISSLKTQVQVIKEDPRIAGTFAGDIITCESQFAEQLVLERIVRRVGDVQKFFEAYPRLKTLKIF